MEKKSNVELQAIEMIKVLQSIIENYVLRNAESESLIGMYIKSPNLDKPIWISPRRADQYSSDQIFIMIFSVTQSASDWLIDSDDVNVEVFHIIMPEGNGSHKNCRIALAYNTYDNIKKKRCIISPFMDGLCLLRAIVIGIAFHSGDAVELKKIVKNNKYQLY